MARQDDRQKPMDMRAVHTDGFYNPNSVTTLSGQVVITQGTLKVTGDLAKIYVDADQQISRIVITGKPAHIQQLDDHGNLMAGDALTLDYDNVNGIATLITQAAVRQQGRGEAHGDKLAYNTRTSEMTGSSGSDGLVHMIFLPKPKPSPAPPAAGQPAPASSAPAAASTSQLPQGQP